MFEINFKEVRDLKENATALRNRKQYPRAIDILEQAITKLTAFLEEKDIPENLAKQIRAELSDTYGMKGGVYRRMNDLDAALRAYQEGREIEDIDKVSTYNLSNVITLSIALGNKSPADGDMQIDLIKAVERLKAETQGSRKDEWWAWSDLAQFYLLLGRPDEARQCYVDARKKSGATKEEILRHSTILEALGKNIDKVTPEISAHIKAIISELL